MRWDAAAQALEQALPGPNGAAQIERLYLPVLSWLKALLGQARSTPGAYIVALGGPQGCGKSTLAQRLVAVLATIGVRAASVSIDDFYLPRDAQVKLAAAHPGNRFLEHRGAPGTHDLPLGGAVLDALRGLRAGERYQVPAYDKSAHGGRGDRAPRQAWPVLQGPLDLIILEGWLLGFQPVDPAQIADPALRVVNGFLSGYRDWYRRIDGLIAFQTADPQDIVRWRVEAEAARAASGQPALDAVAALDYIKRFLPLYALYAEGLCHGQWDADRRLILWLGGDRVPLAPDGASP